MTRDHRPYCRDILDRIRRIENYTVAGRDVFLESELLQDGVIHSFETIGVPMNIVFFCYSILTSRGCHGSLHWNMRGFGIPTGDICPSAQM